MRACSNLTHLHLPPQDVSVNLVGKYRYHVDSAAERGHLPVIVDIILVGRTKIITLHSGIWLKNATDCRLSIRLHVPITTLVAPVGSSNGQQLASDIILGPLEPCQGTFYRVHILKLHSVGGGGFSYRMRFQIIWNYVMQQGAV